MGTMTIAEYDSESLLRSSRVLRVGPDQWSALLESKPGLRHAPIIIEESGCTSNTKAVSSPRERLQDRVVLD